MKNIKLIFSLGLNAFICYLSWPLISNLTSKELQPIATAVSTTTGVLLGFVLAAITLFASIKQNTLIQNTMLTGYFPKLLNKLHSTMGSLLFVCIIFISILFIPDSLTFIVGENIHHRYTSIVTTIGVFLLIHSFILFISSWIEFKNFIETM